MELVATTDFFERLIMVLLFGVYKVTRLVCSIGLLIVSNSSHGERATTLHSSCSKGENTRSFPAIGLEILPLARGLRVESV